MCANVQTAVAVGEIIPSIDPEVREEVGESQVFRGLGIRFTSDIEGGVRSLEATRFSSHRFFEAFRSRTDLQRSFPAPPRVAPAQSRPAPTILIAEDSSDSSEMMRMLLQSKGYKVLSAETGPRALAVALTHQPDMILLDLELPKLDGLTLTRSLGCYREFQGTPIIIVSDRDPRQHRQPALDAGCTDYLLEPIDFRRLDTILQTYAPLSR